MNSGDILSSTSKIIMQHVNPALDRLIPATYHSKSLKSEALNLAQRIMKLSGCWGGGVVIILRRYLTIIIILGRKREEGGALITLPVSCFHLPIMSRFCLVYASKNSIRSKKITRKRRKDSEAKRTAIQMVAFIAPKLTKLSKKKNSIFYHTDSEGTV